MDEAARAYFQAVEQRFIERRGRPLILSPGDVARVADWHRQGIPVEAVLEAIEVHFDRLARRGRAPRRAVTLAYLEDDVLDAWAGVKRRRLGRGPVGQDAGAGAARALATRAEHARLLGGLDAAVGALRAGDETDAALAQCLESARAKLAGKAALFDEGAAEHDDERAEDHLRRLEHALLDRAREVLGEEAVADMARAADAALGDRRARMTDTARERATRQLVDRSLRSRLGISRLSLFYA